MEVFLHVMPRGIVLRRLKTAHNFIKIIKVFAPIAQPVEQLPFKEMVPGSNPGGGTTHFALGIISHMLSRRAFTLIELLVVVAIIAILAVVVVLTLNPAQLLAQSRDANRVSDLATLNSAIGLYQTDVAGGNIGTSSIVYTSLVDSSSTCGTLGLPTLSSGQSYHCSSSSNYHNINDAGWIPINFSKISAGSPFGSLPVDPTNQTSSGLYYTYSTNGTQYQLTALPESTKYKDQYTSNPQIPTYPGVITQGTSQSISPLFDTTNLVSYWPLDEGTGTTAYDKSGSNINGTWSGTPAGTSGYYSTGNNQTWAGEFDGNTDYISLPYTQSSVTQYTIVAWVRTTSTGNLPVVQDRGSGAGDSITLDVGYNGDQGNNPGTVNCGLDSNSLWQGGYTPSVVNNGSWHFIACVFNTPTGTSIVPADFSTYIDGLPQSMIDSSYGSMNSPVTGLGSTTIGYEYAGGGFFSGQIANVRIYTHALSSAEIQMIYNAEK